MNDDERDAMIRRLAHDSLQPPPGPPGGDLAAD